MKLEVLKYPLQFRFEAGTSRGVLKSKDSYFLKLYDPKVPHIFGLGECGPLPGLSPDLAGNLEDALYTCQNVLSDKEQIVPEQVGEVISDQYPALQFALEMAILDLQNGGQRIVYRNNFSNGKASLPINGLVWMGDIKTMLQRVNSKIEEGYTCIKIKVGAINLEDELELLRYIRSQFSSEQITIRLDANGAFKPDLAIGVLEKFSKYTIHSIEQPIKAGNWKAMEKICRQSPIPIALDEELIGVNDLFMKEQLLDTIKPQFIILKPTLLGGLRKSDEWIDLSTKRSIGWWVTSALESNIGLNAIAQLTANYPINMPQGLGTGQLFHNNISSPLELTHGFLIYNNEKKWDLTPLHQL